MVTEPLQQGQWELSALLWINNKQSSSDYMDCVTVQGFLHPLGVPTGKRRAEARPTPTCQNDYRFEMELELPLSHCVLELFEDRRIFQCRHILRDWFVIGNGP